MTRLTRHIIVLLGVSVFLTLNSGCKFGAKSGASNTSGTRLVFDGLNNAPECAVPGAAEKAVCEVRVNSNNTGFSFTWAPATKASGRVRYEIYNDSEFTNLIHQTDLTSWTYELSEDQVLGKSHVFAARAYDDNGVDSNLNFVQIDVPDPRDKQPPEFNGVKVGYSVADFKIQLKWDPSPSADLSHYRVYRILGGKPESTEIARTIERDIFITSIHGEPLVPNQTIEFVVRAVDASGNIDPNDKRVSVTTQFEALPDFNGVAIVERLFGFAGTNSVKLLWSPFKPRNPGIGSITGYKIYQAEVNNDLTRTLERPTANNPTGDGTYVNVSGEGFENTKDSNGEFYIPATESSAVVNNLLSGKEYHFVVRAFVDNGSGVPSSIERNRRVKSGSPNPKQAPTFSGITSVNPGAGVLGFTTGDVTWGFPARDGANTGYVIYYEEGRCNQPFTQGVQSQLIGGESTLFGSISGLTPQRYYRVRVNTVFNNSGDYFEDTNQNCMEFYTEPDPPNFDGIASLVLAPNEEGFDSVVASWNKATGSFSHYIVEASDKADFSSILVASDPLTQIATETYTVRDLPTNKKIYVRVRAEFTYNTVTISGPTPQPSKNIVTQPPAPFGEKITAVEVIGATSLRVKWSAPINGDALFNRYQVWRACGPNAGQDILNFRNLTPLPQFSTSQTDLNDLNLAQDVQCCYQVRASFSNPSYNLESTSTSTAKCATPTIAAPPFNGIVSAVPESGASGFTRMVISWNKVAPEFDTLLSRYEISVADTQDPDPNKREPNFTFSKVGVNKTASSFTLQSLSPNKIYKFAVRAVNATDGEANAAFSGGTATRTRKTRPATPLGDQLKDVKAGGVNSLTLRYSTPTEGVWDRVFIFIASPSSVAVSNYRATIGDDNVNSEGDLVPKPGEIEFSPVQLTQDLSTSGLPGSGSLIEISKSSLNTSADNLINLSGLLENNTYCVQVFAVQYDPSDKEKYLQSGTPGAGCAQPTAAAPEFAGVDTTLTPFPDSTAFTQVKATWSSRPVGECTEIQVIALEDSAIPSDNDPVWQGLPAAQRPACDTDDVTLTNLDPNKTYYIRARAVFILGSNVYPSGGDQVATIMTRPALPEGDGITGAIALNQQGPDGGRLTWTNATAGVWNKVFIFRATASSQPTAITDVRNAALTKGDNSGPVGTPIVTISKSGSTPTTVDDSDNVPVNDHVCYLVKSVYSDGTYYSASENTEVACIQIQYNAYSWNGVTGVTASSQTCTTGSGTSGEVLDGTHMLEATVDSSIVATSTVDEFHIFYSPDGNFNFSAEPFQKVSFFDAFYVDQSPLKIRFGCRGKTLSDGYISIRAFTYGGPQNTTHNATSDAVSVSYSMPQNRYSNYRKIAGAKTDLGYDMFMMTFEASALSGSFNSSNRVTQNESQIKICSNKFHENGTALDSSCTQGGGFSGNPKVQSRPGATPVENVSWHNAFLSCRNSSTSELAVRLPTEEEWLRAAQWTGSSQGSMWSVFSDGNGSNCNSSGSLQNTGSRSACKSGFGLYDVAGGVSEFVDARLTSYNPPVRFSFSPTVGKRRKNGIDNLDNIFHRIEPATLVDLGLALGANYLTPSIADRKQYGHEVQQWLNPTSALPGVGFRCVAFWKNNMPTMNQLALPRQPKLTASDSIPSNFFVGDDKVEKMTLNGNANSGSVTFTFDEWETEVCTGSTPTCTTQSTGLTYQVYRFLKPTKKFEGLATPWALTGGPYSADAPLDPIAVNSSLNARYTPVGSATCSAGTCTFTDNSMTPTALYYYVITASKASGSTAVAKNQHFRSPYYTGEISAQAKSYFRYEPRLRMVAIGLIDESYQSGKIPPQVMSLVSMDRSGYHEDYYIQKYASSKYSGDTYTSGSASPNNPDQTAGWNQPVAADNSGNWVANMAKCRESYSMLGAGGAECGSNDANYVFQSVQGSTVFSTDFGGYYKGCHNSSVQEGSYVYGLELATNAQFDKASDWGDTDYDGIIDDTDHPIYGTLNTEYSLDISAIQKAPTSSRVCPNINDSAAGSYPHCVSRFGVHDIVGQGYAVVADRAISKFGLDNGNDGLSLGFELRSASNFPSTDETNFDFFSGLIPGLATAFSKSLDTAGGRYFYDGATYVNIRRGEKLSTPGRFNIFYTFPPSRTSDGVARCVMD